MFVCFCSYVLLEDKAGQQGGGLFSRQVVEETVKHHICQQELISTGKICAHHENFIKQDTHLFILLLKQ